MAHGCEIIIMNKGDMGPLQEIVEGLMAKIHIFPVGYIAYASIRKRRIY